MFKTLIFLCVVITACVSDPVPTYKDCGSETGKILSLDVTPCKPEPCQLKRNTNVTIIVKLSAKEQVTAGKTVVHGIIDGVPIPFPVHPNDACTNMPCPIASGATVTYKNKIFVLKQYPKHYFKNEYSMYACDNDGNCGWPSAQTRGEVGNSRPEWKGSHLFCYSSCHCGLE